MIIKLTPAEIKSFVGAKLGFSPGSFDLEIVNPEPQLLAAFKATIREFPRFLTDQRISAIKRFRDLVPKAADGYSSVGLADAKWAVENPLTTLANLERTGRIQG